MKIELTNKQFRRLLDLVYIGNWILNSTRGTDRLTDYDDLESRLFGLCPEHGMDILCENRGPVALPSQAFAEGGIHEAIMDYEDTVFFEILAEELAHRDLYAYGEIADPEELATRINAYITEFEENGLSNILVDADLS